MLIILLTCPVIFLTANEAIAHPTLTSTEMGCVTAKSHDFCLQNGSFLIAGLTIRFKVFILAIMWTKSHCAWERNRKGQRLQSDAASMLTKPCIFLAGPNFRFLSHPTAGLKTTVIYLIFIHKCINTNHFAAYNKSPAHSVHFKESTPSSEVPFQWHETIIYLKGT